ncbi:MAG: hypothetical protein MUP97_13260 [Acidimicrobiia bacterium]|nr:hypothetical protein [Acidimicrobiia bacterium]
MSVLKRRLETPRSRFFAACALGALVATAIFAYFAFEGRIDPFGRVLLANFYEVQARSWLHGHWDAGPGSYFFERFNVDGRFYTYFGPWPALLRLPFVAFTRELDGKLSRVSMLLAFVVMLTYASRLSWQARVLLRGDGRPTRPELVGAGAFVFVAGCGSTALFLASESWVYHEAILWGIAWSVASYSYLTAYLVSPRTRTLALASITAAFAYLSRGSVGLGPVVALGVVLLARLATAARGAWLRRSAARATSVVSDPNEEPGEPGTHVAVSWWLRVLGLGTDQANRSFWPLVVATGAPVALYSYVNWVKFGTLLGTPPYELQDQLAARASRQAALAANGGTLFGFKYAPTLLLDYFRPDAISFDRLFPWVSFAPPPRIIGGVTFEAVNFSSSVPVTSTLLFLLTIVGVVAVIRAPRPEGGGATAAALRVPLLGAAVGCAGMFVLAFLEERYQGDFVPLFVVGGAVGFWYVARLIADRSRGVRVATMTALVLAGVWSCWVTGSLTLLQQRAYGPLVTNDTRAALIDAQLDIHDVVPGGAPSRVLRGDLPLPAPASPNTLLVVGDCDGLYWSNGRFWHPVEQTPRTGRFRLRLEVADAPAGTLEPVRSATDPRGSSILWLRHLEGGRVRFEYEWTGENQSLIEGVTPDAAEIGQRTGDACALPGDSTADFALRMDPAGYVGVGRSGNQLMSTFAPVADSPARIGEQDVSDRGTRTFDGTIRRLATPTPMCNRLTEDPKDS